MSKEKSLAKLLKTLRSSIEGAERLKRAEEMGYDTSKIYLHGSHRTDIGLPSTGGNFKAFDGTYGNGAYFTDDIDYANSYAQNISSETLDALNKKNNDLSYGQTNYPVFLKKTDASYRDPLNESLKKDVVDRVSALSKVRPEKVSKADIEVVKNVKDNYGLFNVSSDYLDSKSVSKAYKKAGFNNVNPTADVNIVVEPEGNVKSIYAKFKDEKGLMSGAAALGSGINETIDSNPLKTLSNLYGKYKSKQEKFVEPFSERLSNDLSFNQKGIQKDILKSAITESTDPLGYVGGGVGHGIMLLDFMRSDDE